MLEDLLRGQGLKHATVKERLILELFRDNWERRLYKRKHEIDADVFIPAKLGHHARYEIRESIRKALEASESPTVKRIV